MQSEGSSSSYYPEKFQQPSDEELLLALKEVINRDNKALQMRLPIMETKMDANMIAKIGTNCTNLSREMSAIMERLAIQAEELENFQKE